MTTTSPTRTLLLIGAGDLGTEIGLRYLSDCEGLEVPVVVAVRRSVGVLPEMFTPVEGDVTRGLPGGVAEALPDGPTDVVVCLTAGARDEAAYRRVFIDGLTAVLRDVARLRRRPKRAVFVSSTGVCAAEGDVDETTPAEPSTPTSRVLAEAEELFLRALPKETRGIVVRPSGLYGPGREWFINQVRSGQVAKPDRMTHRIHRDDAARAIVHLLTMPSRPDGHYLLTDDAPAPAGEVASFLAEELGVKAPEWGGTSTDSRRLVNARLRATGFAFTYPTYVEGYRAVLAGPGTRHP